MATYTTNYNLNKPTFAELADVRTFNGNMDIIDTVMNASQNSIAEPYDSTETYEEGDMVMYELYLYKCLEETTGTWDATKWERAYSASSGAGITYPQDATKYLNGMGQWTVPAGGGGSGVNYSTTEQVIGTWIDGSTIYQKTITLVASATDNTIPYTDDVNVLVKAYGIFSDSNGAQTFFPYTDGEDYASTYKHASNGIHLLCSNWFINNRPNVTLTLQYTKVTV